MMEDVPATVVLVEGVSDLIALTTLARLRGRDLDRAGVQVVPMGGATNVGRYLREYRSGTAAVRLAGLCDLAEARYFRKALERTGLAPELAEDHSPSAMATHGFFVSARDLEDELIRCLGAPAVVEVIERQGELALFRTFQKQPAQRLKPVEAQLHRFLGTHSGRKAQYARALVEALPAAAAPPPLEGLLDHL